MPKHKQGVVSVDKIIGSRTGRGVTLIGSTRHGRRGGRSVCTHFWVRQNPAKPGPALKETLVGSRCPRMKRNLQERVKEDQPSNMLEGGKDAQYPILRAVFSWEASHTESLSQQSSTAKNLHPGQGWALQSHRGTVPGNPVSVLVAKKKSKYCLCT